MVVIQKGTDQLTIEWAGHSQCWEEDTVTESGHPERGVACHIRGWEGFLERVWQRSLKEEKRERKWRGVNPRQVQSLHVLMWTVDVDGQLTFFGVLVCAGP